MQRAVLLLAFASAATGGEILQGPTGRVLPGQAVFLDVEPANVGDDPKFECYPQNSYWRAVVDREGKATVFFAAPVGQKPTTYLFIFASNRDGKTVIDTCAVPVGDAGPTPPGPTPPAPDPVPAPVAALRKWARDKAVEVIQQKDLLWRTAPRLAESFERIGNNAADYGNDDAFIAATRQANTAALGEAARQWEPWRMALGERLDGMAASGTWRREHWHAGWLAIAAGLREAR